MKLNFTRHIVGLLLASSLFSYNYSQCYYVVDMQDSWGDGWNGASLDVSINGSLVSSLTFTNGGNFTDSVFSLNGDFVEFYFNSGDWDTEITYQIYDPSSNQIGSYGPYPNNQGNSGPVTSDTSNSTCSPQFVNVTFQVDMSNVSSSFTTPEINGNWNNFCGNCDPMVDPDGDGIWEKTVSLFTGTYEYIFSADSLSIQESIDPNSLCSNGSFILPRRYINVGAFDVILPVVCWNSCEACNDFPQPPTGITCNTGNAGIVFTDDCEAQGNWTGNFGTSNGTWQVNDGGTASGGTGPDGAHSGVNYFYYESSTWGGGGPSLFDTATIITPPIDLSNMYDDAELTFWMHARGSSMGSLAVGLSNSPNGPFNNVYYQFGEIHANANDPWSQIGINVGNYVGQTLYVSFTYARLPNANPSYTGDLAIDLIEVNSCSTCPSPSLLSSNNITSSSATLTWAPSGNETQWMIHYNNATMVTSTIPTTLTGLSPNTLYNCHVSAICGPGDTSSLSTPTFFTTACAPTLAPINENFDAGFSPCWSQDIFNDDFDWELEDGGTPSAGTGPDDDVSIGGNYMYTEASNPRQDGDFAIMYSEEIDLSNLSSAEVRFFTHMYGSAIGELQVDMYDNGSYTTIFNKIGEQVDAWVEEVILINPTSNIIHFRITGILGVNANGDTWPGDIAIDEFSVVEPIANDIEVSTTNMVSECEFTSAEQLSMNIKNNGIALQTNFDVSYTINGGQQVFETCNLVLNGGDSANYTFSAPVDLSNDGVYNISFQSHLSNDQVSSNDGFTTIIENYLSPSIPTTVDDTICSGDTAILQATTTEGLINWYTDVNGNNTLSSSTVTPTTTTTYYATVQACDFYRDDMEGYLAGNLIAQSSPNWATWSGSVGGQDDAFISNSQAFSGSNSIYLNYLNDDDLYLPFDQVYNSGEVEIIFNMYVVTNAHLNLQDDLPVSSPEILDLSFTNNGMLEINIGGTLLIGTYPGTNQWFELKITGDLSSSIWGVYVNGAYQGGTVAANGNNIASVNFKPEMGDEYYIDDVEWYVISDDDCVSSTTPVTVYVEDCSHLNGVSYETIDIYPIPSFGQLNINSNTKIKCITVTDLTGKSIKSFYPTYNTNLNLDLSNMSSGQYYLRFETEKSIVFKKIILKK